MSETTSRPISADGVAKGHLDLHGDLLSNPISRFMADLESLPGCSELFRQPIPNNYVFLLLNGAFSVDEYLAEIARATEPMNQANASVYAYCLKLMKELPPESALDPELIQLMGGWKRTTTTSVNLKGVAFAEEMFARLGACGVDAHSRWRTLAPELRQIFLDIPPKILNLLRINLSVPQGRVLPLLQRLIEEVFAPSEDFALIERVEVAKPNLNNDAKVKNYPTLILYLTAGANKPECRERVERFFARLVPVLGGYEHGLEAESHFADTLFPFVTFTQGYKLWKRYLDLVGLLDEVYGREHSHAYIRRADGNFPSVLSPFRRQ